MIASKFGIGQQVRHRMLGYPGVVVDVDAKYSLKEPAAERVEESEALLSAPWYHVIMEDDDGETIHTYVAESQLSWEFPVGQQSHPSLDALAASVRQQLQAPCLRH